MDPKTFPRLFELYELIPKGIESDQFYFPRFDKTIMLSPTAKFHFQLLENELSKLDKASWQLMKNEVKSLLVNKDPKRNWEQLISKLNEAKGYCYLKKIGCSSVQIIPRSKENGIKTPDLEGTKFETVYLCEVKTINISDFEIEKRKVISARDAQYNLPPDFFDKFDSVVEKAKSQLLSYKKGIISKKIIYFIINFDEPLSIYFECYRAEYKEQIIKHLEGRNYDFDIKIHNLLE